MSLEAALQKALSIRLNLQISLSQLPIIDEWMDIHLDRWLEHNPTPPDMPMGEEVSFLAMLGSDLRRVWWGAWGDPRGFVPRMADYFKLCNIAKSDAQVLDQMGEALEPKLVGSWIGVWGGKVTTGWHFADPQPWTKIEGMFGTHEAKFQLKKWAGEHKIERIERFTQSIGDTSYSELELAIPGDTAEAQIEALSRAFEQFGGGPVDRAVRDRLATTHMPAFGLAVRIRGGKIVRVGGLAPGMSIDAIEGLARDAKVGFDPKLPKLVGALGSGIARVEYGRAGDKAGLDIYIDPGESAAATQQPAAAGESN